MLSHLSYFIILFSNYKSFVYGLTRKYTYKYGFAELIACVFACIALLYNIAEGWVGLIKVSFLNPTLREEFCIPHWTW